MTVRLDRPSGCRSTPQATRAATAPYPATATGPAYDSRALIENNPGIEYTPVTRDAEPQHSFYSAIPNPIGEEGIETIGGGQLLAGVRPTIFGDGTKTRDYIYVGDIVRANLAAMEEPGDNQIYNLAHSTEVSDFELFDVVRTAVGADVEPFYVPKRPGEADRVSLDCDRAKSSLLWEPQVRLADGISRTVDYLRSHNPPPLKGGKLYGTVARATGTYHCTPGGHGVNA